MNINWMFLKRVSMISQFYSQSRWYFPWNPIVLFCKIQRIVPCDHHKNRGFIEMFHDVYPYETMNLWINRMIYIDLSISYPQSIPQTQSNPIYMYKYPIDIRSKSQAHIPISSTSQIFHPLVLHQHLHHLHPLSPAGVAVRVKTHGYGAGEHVRQMRAWLFGPFLTQKVGMKNQKKMQVEWKELWIWPK